MSIPEGGGTQGGREDEREGAESLRHYGVPGGNEGKYGGRAATERVKETAVASERLLAGNEMGRGKEEGTVREPTAGSSRHHC